MVRVLSILACLLILITGTAFGQGAVCQFYWVEVCPDCQEWFPLTYDCADPESLALDTTCTVLLMIDTDNSAAWGQTYTPIDEVCPIGHNGAIGEVWPTNQWPLSGGGFISPVLQFFGSVPTFQLVYLLAGKWINTVFHPGWTSQRFVINPGVSEYFVTCPTGGSFGDPCWVCYMDPGGVALEAIPEPCDSPPGQVQNVHASDDDCEFPSLILITWDNLEDETGYAVLRNDSVIAHVWMGITSYSDTVYSDGTYSVRAYNDCGSGPESLPDAGSRPILPNPPENVQASDSLCDGILITWTDMADNETGFSVGRSPQGNPFDTIFYIDEPNLESFFDSTALPDTIYTYVVAAGDACGYNASPGDVGLRWRVPAQVTGLTAVGECDRILLAWQPDSGNIDSYCVFRDDIPEAIAVLAASITQYIDSLDEAFPHEYHICALNGCGSSIASDPISARQLLLFEYAQPIPDTIYCTQEFTIDGRFCDSVDSVNIWLSFDGEPFNTYLGGFENPVVPFSMTIPDIGRQLVPARLSVAATRIGHYTESHISNYFVIDCLMDVDAANRSMPAAIALHQNYPNPFNAETSISYDLPTSAFVKLTLYDLIGREVKTLAEGVQTAGHHVVHIDANHLPSGIYFYRLEAEHFSDMKKMILLK